MSAKILIIEDNFSNMKLASDLLEYNGFDVIKAYDGAEGLSVLENTVPDLILLDLQLPGISGFDVFNIIKKDKRLNNVKIIALTAQATEADKIKIENYGFFYQIFKPLDTREFVKKIKSLF